MFILVFSCSFFLLFPCVFVERIWGRDILDMEGTEGREGFVSYRLLERLVSSLV